VKIEKLQFNNFRGISNTTLEFGDQLTVLIGENGVGKSSILSAVTHLLFPFTKWASRGTFGHRSLREKDLNVLSDHCFIELDVCLNGSDTSYKLRSEFDPKSTTQKFDYKALQEALTGGWDKQIDELAQLEKSIPTLIYSVDQARSSYSVDANVNQFANKDLSIETAYLETKNSLDLFESWFDQRDAQEARAQRNDRSYVDLQLAATRDAILASSGFSLRFDNDPPRGLRAKKGNIELTIDQLSSGERVMMLMIGHIAMRLGLLQSKDPLMGKGIVLIDEVELHLHPSWQRKILPLLLKTFPNVQFIVATHSPQVIGEIMGDSLRVIRRLDDKSHINTWNEETFGRDSNTLLNTLFETTEKNSELGEKIANLNSKIEAGNITEAKELVDKVVSELGYESVDLTVAKARIARRLNG